MKDATLETQAELELRLGKGIANDPSAENYQRAYDEFHCYLLKYGIRNVPSQGYIYKQTLSLFDRRLLKLVGKNKKVLDIGCGEGTLALACAANNNHVVGMDISQVAINLAESRKKRLPVHFMIGDARKLKFPDDAFDVVICKDMIEHISQEDFKVHLKEVARVLKQGGCYILYTPSKLLGDLSLGLHIKEYGLADLTLILNQSTFEVEVVCHWLYLLGFPVVIRNRLLISLLLAYERLVARTKIGRLIAAWGKLSYMIIPAVWLRCVKRG
jgi:2-polyprenyl-3-methyl-5-hydroxy-6-metoxy-1,4-benzoquinol methylase